MEGILGVIAALIINILVLKASTVWNGSGSHGHLLLRRIFRLKTSTMTLWAKALDRLAGSFIGSCSELSLQSGEHRRQQIRSILPIPPLFPSTGRMRTKTAMEVLKQFIGSSTAKESQMISQLKFGLMVTNDGFHRGTVNSNLSDMLWSRDVSMSSSQLSDKECAFVMTQP